MIMETINILGVNISRVRMRQTVQMIENFLKNGAQHYIVTPNPEFLMAAKKDKEFKKILNKADISLPDGAGLLWAATLDQSTRPRHPLRQRRNQAYSNHQRSTIFKKFKIWIKGLIYGLALLIYPEYCKKALPERVTGADMAWQIGELCEQKNCSIYLLGGKEGVAMAAALKLKQKFPKLKIAGAEMGLTDLEPKINGESKENLDLIGRINKARPDVLLVAFGQIKQEKWIDENLKKISSVKVAMGVGGAFDFMAGAAKRAPKSIQKFGLEWLWRLLLQPWRMSRIITATFRFAKAVINEKIKNQA